MITLELSLDHAREVLLACRARSRAVGHCGTCKRLLDEVDAALRSFVTAGGAGVPAESLCTGAPEKLPDLREKGQGW